MTDRIPVILDTDIGTDIDDTWALALLLRSPELDLKLVVTETGNTEHRAALAARLLEVAGRGDVPIGIGKRTPDKPYPQAAWVKDYDLRRYPGQVHADGVQALIETLEAAPEPMTLICIGPVPNIAAALARAPHIAQKARFVGMHGSVRLGYDGSPTPAPEYNVYDDVPACRVALAAPWEVTLTPLDTCGLVRLRGERYQAVRDSADPLARAVIDAFRVWSGSVPWETGTGPDYESSVLFDTAAVYLAFSEALMGMETLGLRVTDSGHTVIDPSARPIRCATRWKDLGGFESLLVERLTGLR